MDWTDAQKPSVVSRMMFNWVSCRKWNAYKVDSTSSKKVHSHIHCGELAQSYVMLNYHVNIYD